MMRIDIKCIQSYANTILQNNINKFLSDRLNRVAIGYFFL